MEADEPIIRPLPSVDEFVDLVDMALHPDVVTDEQVSALIKLITVPANPEDDHSWELANAAARHAYTKTEHFERSFATFTGHPRFAPYRSERTVIEATDREM